MTEDEAARELAEHLAYVSGMDPRELHGRLRDAMSVLEHRFDPTNPDVIVVKRLLAGMSLDEVVYGELHPRPTTEVRDDGETA